MIHHISDGVSRLLDTDDDLAAVQHTFQDIIGEMGLSHFLYMERPPPIPDLEPGIPPLVLGCSPEVVDQYLTVVSPVDDPISRELNRRVAPFTVEDAFRNHFAPPRYSKAMALLDDIGLANGLVVPLVSQQGLHYSSTVFTGERGKAAADVLSQAGHGVHVLSAYFHQRVREILARQKPEGPKLLTPRERECLLWAACGKTAWEISRILKIAERTVKFHLANASRRLDTSNTTHAVARAILRGEFMS